MQHILPRTVAAFLTERGLFAEAGAVACSGGADSVALLLALHELKRPVMVAHVNHQLRGPESDGDEEFVRALAERLKLPFQATKIDLPSVNLEAAARRKRYEWFATLGVSWIATGHTADDQAETVLHRIIRGTGLQGLRGIHDELEQSPPTPQSPPVATGGLLVMRPMLMMPRATILDYLQSKKQTFRTDSSNTDERFTRNRIRQELIPLLKTFNPEVVSILTRLSDQARDAHAVIAAEAEAILEIAMKPMAGTRLIFDRDVLATTTAAIVCEALRLAWQGQSWPIDGMTYQHWKRLASLEPGDYPGHIRLTLKERVVQLGPMK